jgi:LysR family glycine cleavage system transcriptional activator
LGVGQANPAFIQDEVSNGRLVMINPAITALVGAVTSTEAATDLARQFSLWLRDFGTEPGLLFR